MAKRVFACAGSLAVLLACPSVGAAQTWNGPGLNAQQFKAIPPGGPAPRRDLTGIWDAGPGGVGGAAQEAEREAARAPFTPLGEQMVRANKPGNGPRMVPVENTRLVGAIATPVFVDANTNELLSTPLWFTALMRP